MGLKRITALLCLLVLLMGLLAPGVYAAREDTVYVRKHVSLLYDNSGSMKMPLTGTKNLKWAYGSYAAQMFAGLLNDMDTLSVTFMNSKDAAGQIHSSLTDSISLPMTGDRQAQVTKLLERTGWATGNTPVTSIHDALDVLIRQGLKSDAELAGAELSGAEQYWLVLTTDGVFDTSEADKEAYYNLPADEVAATIEQILDDYSSLQVVYFALGAKNDTSKYKAVDFGTYSTLTAYPNFTSFYAEDQDKIVDTMQTLSNRISGRYAVSEGLSADGNTVTMTISGESSPVRNIAVLAQRTNARLVSAKMADGTALDIVRSARVEYPQNEEYDQMDPGTLGGYSAVVSCGAGKIPAGKVVLTFDQPVSVSDLSLMYEPAIYVSLDLQRQTADGGWEDVPYSGKLVEGDTLRVQYAICEDGSDEPIDPARLPGKTLAEISCDGEAMELGEAFTVKAGSSLLTATVSMMDGAYCVTTSRTLRGLKFTDFQVSSSGPLTMRLNDLKENKDLSVDFTVSMDGIPATNDQLASFTLDMGGLEGDVTLPGGGVVRFTPCAPEGSSGTYTVCLSCDGQNKATETVTVEPNPTTYSAEAGDALAVYDKDVPDNTEGLRFFVTAHKDEGDFPVNVEESFAFSVVAEDSQGQPLDGTLKFVTDGEIAFVPGGNDARVGDYTVTLYYGDQILAAGQVAVLRYNAQYRVEPLLPENREVRRFDLLHNETAVDFAVYADGVPCTEEQLSAMLGGIIRTEMDRGGLIRLDVTVEQRNGISVVRARPASTTDSAFVAFFQKAFIALGWFGGVPKGDLTISLTVDAEKGDSASGVLQLTSTAFEDIFYMILLAAILVALVLLSLFIYSNLRMSRIKPGRLYFFEIAPDGTGYYYRRSSSTRKVYKGLHLRLRPTPQRMRFRDVVFAADKNDKPAGKWGKKRTPVALLSGVHSALEAFSSVDQSDDADKLIRELKATASDPEIMSERFVLGISSTQLVDGEDEHEGKAYTMPYRMREDGFLQRAGADGSIRIWMYRPFLRKRRGKKSRISL